ncbi:acyltransferase family protein [Vibrio coralliirubri]|uniref:acyltransferase family protein n=1 Tax=Vibrio coralliirubri TaxID=1516159 RepID=UPI00063A70FE|nr:acyltransferase family protein [Vibrio coralliirubri]CDU11731.1 Acyltransferase [Vibrio coralliirubri]
MNFRYDINGLRAIAVIAVVLFHFNPSWVPGGFAGVDVFFVISGFLMTSIIFRGLENDDFKLFKFYVARANRIIPALAVLCAVLLIFGWFYLTPMDYRALGKHAASSMGFLSNVIYWRESGYFDAASHEKWLLHTWSLSVEWQFYIIYPVVLMALKRFLSITNIKRLLVVGTLLGFSFSVIATIKWPNPAYYLLPTRAWEMMFGGLAYLYPIALKAKQKRLAEYVGLALILASYALISSKVAWPGHWALVPVLGAYLVIIANRQDSFITNNSVFQALGKWSYSIYLWHWPIVVSLAYFQLGQELAYFGIFFSIIFGFLSSRYIESFRFRSFSLWREIWKVGPVYTMLLVGIVASTVYIRQGFDIRSLNNYSIAQQRERLRPNHGLNKLCEGKFTLAKECRTSDTPEVLFWGDSFTMHLVPGFIASNTEAKLIQLTKSSCAPILDVSVERGGGFAQECINFNKSVYEWLNEHKNRIKTVVLSSRFSFYPNTSKFPFVDANGRELTPKQINIDSQFRRTINKIESLGIRVVIVSPIPENGINLGKCLDKNFFFGNKLESCDFVKQNESSATRQIFSWFNALEDDFNVVDMREVMCTGEVCKTTLNDKFIYRDSGHLSYEGSVELGKKVGFYNLLIDSNPS